MVCSIWSVSSLEDSSVDSISSPPFDLAIKVIQMCPLLVEGLVHEPDNILAVPRFVILAQQVDGEVLIGMDFATDKPVALAIGKSPQHRQPAGLV